MVELNGPESKFFQHPPPHAIDLWGQKVFTIEVDKFFAFMEHLQKETGTLMFLDLCGVDNLNRSDTEHKRFEVVYHLLNMENHERIRVKVHLQDGEKISSVVSLWKVADWFERETFDLLGISFGDRVLERLLTHEGFKGHPLRKDFVAAKFSILDNDLEKEQISKPSHPKENEIQDNLDQDVDEGIGQLNWIEIGPAHPITKGSMQISCEIDGETIRRTKIKIGFQHRCFEKISEGIHYRQILPYTDRLNYQSGPMNNIGLCKAIEDFLKLEIPDRAKGARMILVELGRIMDHLLSIGYFAQVLQMDSCYWVCLEERERVCELFEKLGGARMTVTLPQFGGLSQDLHSSWMTLLLTNLKILQSNLLKIHKNLVKSRLWKERTRVGKISGHDAIAWGYTGPCLRACGINYDLRKVTPYYFYDQVEFQVPLGLEGSCYDRYLVRYEEIHESCRIIYQVLENLPRGPILAEDERVILPNKSKVYSQMPDLLQHIERYTQGLKLPKGEIYSFTEAANGELGYFIISDGQNTPYRLKVRPPCYPIFESLPEVIEGKNLSDALIIFASMNIVPGELDR